MGAFVHAAVAVCVVRRWRGCDNIFNLYNVCRLYICRIEPASLYTYLSNMGTIKLKFSHLHTPQSPSSLLPPPVPQTSRSCSDSKIHLPSLEQNNVAHSSLDVQSAHSSLPKHLVVDSALLNTHLPRKQKSVLQSLVELHSEHSLPALMLHLSSEALVPSKHIPFLHSFDLHSLFLAQFPHSSTEKHSREVLLLSVHLPLVQKLDAH